MHQEVVTLSMTDLSESHGASLQRGEISRWDRKAGARRAQCQAKKTGKTEEKVRK